MRRTKKFIDLSALAQIVFVEKTLLKSLLLKINNLNHLKLKELKKRASTGKTESTSKRRRIMVLNSDSEASEAGLFS